MSCGWLANLVVVGMLALLVALGLTAPAASSSAASEPAVVPLAPSPARAGLSDWLRLCADDPVALETILVASAPDGTRSASVLMAHPSADVRRAALEHLSRADDFPLFTLLAHARHDADEAVRIEALARAVKRAGSDRGSVVYVALELVCGDPSSRVRQVAVAVLAEWGEEDVVATLLAALPQEPDADVRLALLGGIERLSGRE